MRIKPCIKPEEHWSFAYINTTTTAALIIVSLIHISNLFSCPIVEEPVEVPAMKMSSDDTTGFYDNVDHPSVSSG